MGGDGDGSGLVFTEGEGADADEAAVNESRFTLVDRDRGFAIGVADDDGDVGGAVASRTIGDEDFVAFGLGQSGGELDLLLSFEEVFVVKVAFADPWAGLARFFQSPMSLASAESMTMPGRSAGLREPCESSFPSWLLKVEIWVESFASDSRACSISPELVTSSLVVAKEVTPEAALPLPMDSVLWKMPARA